ncbi:MAG: hypothetical protein JSU70_08955, partial [Phycisphaerales bacterium]
DYPYDMVQVRYSIGGDNGPPDPDLSKFVRDWNEKHAYPRLVVATTSEMFHEFERRYAKQIPTARGDFTPYWEDGAASSARETSLNRDAAERLVQAETMWAMLNPGGYPADEFRQAWRNTILYDEHTWGSWNSISDPEGNFTKGQWKIKQAFALDADVQSHKLLRSAVASRSGTARAVTAVDVFNTSSWARTDLVILPKDLQVAGDVVASSNTDSVPSQRLSTGELAFLASDIPPLGAKRYILRAGRTPRSGRARAEGARLSNGKITVTVDEDTGAIRSLKCSETDIDLVAADAELGINDYLYVAGRNPKDPKRNNPVTITVKEDGPLVAALLIESEAPGCDKLTRELRLIDGLDRLDIINTLQKRKIYDKEAVHFAFPFSIPEGVMRMDIPWAVVRPEVDQLPGACKNYFTVQRWCDVSNQDYGVTWATIDAPLIEVGKITCDPIAVGWIRHLERSTTLYSYVMNNYWETNYKASQQGATTFRYSIKPHGHFSSADASRFGTERSQPLVAVPVGRRTPVPGSLFTVEPVDVIVTALKPAEASDALIIRLFNAGGRPEKARIVWGQLKPTTLWLSTLAEEEISKMDRPIEMAPYEIVTLRASLSER